MKDNSPYVYLRQSEEETTILDFQIVCSVEIYQVQKKGEQLKLSKATLTNTQKLCSNVFDSVQEKLFAAESSHNNTESESEADAASDSSPALKQRVIVKAKRQYPQSQAAKATTKRANKTVPNVVADDVQDLSP